TDRFENQGQVAQAENPPNGSEFTKRAQNQQNQMMNIAQQPAQKDDLNIAALNLRGNGEDLVAGKPLGSTRSQPVVVRLGPMVPLWWTAGDQPKRLLLVRLVQVGPRQVCQGIV